MSDVDVVNFKFTTSSDLSHDSSKASMSGKFRGHSWHTILLYSPQPWPHHATTRQEELQRLDHELHQAAVPLQSLQSAV